MSDKALASAEPSPEATAGSHVIEHSHPGHPEDAALPQESPGGVDQHVPNAARIYDWLIGGKDHYAADRAAGRRLAAAIPGIRQAAADNRAFLARVTRYLAAEAGISQFIDIGSGLPGPSPVHEIARETQPGVRVVYVDHDPVVVAHARALLADHSRTGPSKVTAVEADLRYPRNLLTMREIRDTIDLTQPAAVLMIAVLHFIPDDADPHGIVEAITARLAPGSYLALSHGTADHLDPGAAQAARAAYDGASVPGIPRTRDEIERFLAGPQPVPPGVTDVTKWRPAPGQNSPGQRSGRPILFYGGVARIPPQ
jgi:O-methyltransferase involved in polyketide biosynthesis